MSGEEHTESYYAATRNDQTTYPQLEGEHDSICQALAAYKPD